MGEPTGPLSGIRTLSLIATLALPFTVLSSKQAVSSLRWRPEFVTLALDRWAQTHSVQQRLSTICLHHFVYINMHANLTQLQHCARTYSDNTNASASLPKPVQAMSSWAQTMDYTISAWHAQRIMDLAHSADIRGQTSVSLDSPTSSTSDRTLEEAPHVPYAIYFATLILWCGALYVNSSSSRSVLLHLQMGAAVLSGLRSRVAKLLAQALLGAKPG